MATSKTLTPTNVTIQIPAFTDKPDQRVNTNCIDKEADAINALDSKIAKQSGTATMDTTNTSGGTVKYEKVGNIVVVYVDSVVAKERLNGTQVIASGLPNSSASRQLSLCNQTVHEAVRCQITTTGNFTALYDAIEIGEQICGTFTYMV